MKYVRQVKTQDELAILVKAARLNETILRYTMDVWRPGMTWRDLTTAYHVKCAELGGFVRDPGAIVVGNRGADDWSFPMVGRQTEDYEIQVGDSMMWDCHGTYNGYCWDGGKTWVVEGAREGAAKTIEVAAVEAMKQIESHMVPGASLAELQRLGLDTIRRHGVPDPDRALIFFHGLGLEHGDLEISTLSRGDIALEKDMVMSMHVVYPGGPRERFYIEDNALVTDQGGKSLYSWGVEPFH
jgi:Xaa-Pro aminopeptidase